MEKDYSREHLMTPEGKDELAKHLNTLIKNPGLGMRAHLCKMGGEGLAFEQWDIDRFSWDGNVLVTEARGVDENHRVFNVKRELEELTVDEKGPSMVYYITEGGDSVQYMLTLNQRRR